MRDGTKFSSWKDFALAVMDELDDLHDSREKLQVSYDTLKDDYKEFKTRVYTVIAIVVLVFGALEITVRL